MGPQQGFAVDVFLQKALAHHQAEVAPCPAPGRIRGLVDDVAQVVEPAGCRRLARTDPALPRLAAFPGLGGEAEDLDLHAATLQRARQNVGTSGGNGNRTPAHGSRVVQKQRHDRVAEIGVPLLLEGKRGHWIGYGTGQSGGVQKPFFKVEVPGPVLLRHQLALQPVGKARHGPLQVGQLLVQEPAQTIKLRHVAKFFSGNRLVKLGGEHAVVGFGPVGERRIGPVAFARLLGILRHVLIGEVFHIGFGGFRIAAFLLFAGKFHLLRRGFLFAGIFFAVVTRLSFVVVALVLVFFRVHVLVVIAKLIAHVERFQDVAKTGGEGILVLDFGFQPVEVGTGLVLDPATPHVDELGRAFRRLRAGQAFAHQQGQGILQRRFFPAGDIRRTGLAEPVVKHHRQVVGNPLHPACANGFAAGLFDRFEDRPRVRALRHVLGMNSLVVAGNAQGDAVRQATGDRDLARVDLARGLGQARGHAAETGPVTGKDDFQFRLSGNRPHGTGHRLLEWLGARCGLVARKGIVTRPRCHRDLSS